MNSFPGKGEFCRLAEKHTIVPVCTVVDTDMDTPISLYYKLVEEEAVYLLESAENNKTFGRYSFLGLRPFAKLVSFKEHTIIRMDKGTITIAESPLKAIKQFLDGYSYPQLPDMPPFTAGGVGYVCYDAVATWERVRGKVVPPDMVLAELQFCKNMIIMDHLTHTTTLVELVIIDNSAQDCSYQYEEALTNLKNIAGKCRTSLPKESICSLAKNDIAVNFDTDSHAANYMDMVRRAKKHIAAGDIFQVVPSQRFEAAVIGISPFSLYRRLRRVNPSPYMFYLNFDNRQLVGASPEMLVKIQNRQVYTCPIAGTRPRGQDQNADEKLATELQADEKELAEHSMLVDLGRNDLGRISLPGTVEITRYREVERFSHVMHLVSEVTGKLDPSLGAMDVLAACFPAGTVSGAPKVRAMEIIEELEKKERGVYSGAVGYFDFNGNMNTCIAIRTMVVEGERVSIQAGAGIVADSIPEQEYREVLQKARALFRILEGM